MSGSRSGSGSDDTDLVSVDETFYDTVSVNGRTYHQTSLDRNVYHMPIDPRELERQHEEHEAFKWLFGNALGMDGITGPGKALDCGGGNCVWAREFATSWPDCEVVVTDICPLLFPEQDKLPRNINLQVDDLNSSFTFERGEFDFVHSRQVILGIQSSRGWRSYIADCARCLKSGGRVQLVEFYYNIQSDNGSINDGSALRQWSLKFKEACQMTGKEIQAPNRFTGMMQDAGLNIREQRFLQVPLSPWKLSPDQSLETAEKFSTLMFKHLNTISEYLFRNVLDMPEPEFHVFMSSVHREMLDVSKKAYLALYVVIGQKP